MISEFSQMIHCMVLESPISARDLAKAVGKPYSTLFQRCARSIPMIPGLSSAWKRILEKTGDLSSLEYMLHRLGLGLAPLDTPLAAAWRRRPDRVSAFSAVETVNGPAVHEQGEEGLRA